MPVCRADRDGGTLRWGHEVSVGYFPQDHTGAIQKGLTAVEWLHQFDPDASRQDIHGLLGQMLFSGEEGLKPTEALSGGETARLLFCRIMLQKPNVLVLDEPTNHLDLESINALNVALQKYEGTIFLVTHDEDLLEEVGTRVWHVRPRTHRRLQGQLRRAHQFAGVIAALPPSQVLHLRIALTRRESRTSDLVLFTTRDISRGAVIARCGSNEVSDGGETMVDSRKGSAMADRIDDLTERVQAVEEKLDRLSASVTHLSASVDQRFEQVDRRFEQVDRRFDQVDAAFLEQRQYIEFAYSRLEAKMDAGFGRVERKLDQFIDVQLQTNQLVDRRLRALEERGRASDAQP